MPSITIPASDKPTTLAPATLGARATRLTRALLATRADLTPVLLRLTLAVVFLPHGLQKLFGWFGGPGFDGVMGFLTGGMGLPWIVALAVVLFESVGALFLAIGLLSRPAALGLIAVMLGAIVTVHLPNGFFMNWSGTAAGEGFEYHLLAIALLVAVVIHGGGRWSVDRALARRLER
ncbi:MAG: DoxX family protein [Planctomycetota bacterium]